MRILLVLITLLFFVPIFSIYSQEITIDSNDPVQCEGILLDTGGNLNPYSADESHSITWCAQTPETVLNLYWNIFSLVENSILTIYDGDSNDSPLIGSFSGTELQSLNITSSNPTGCLTVEFVSVQGGGNFAAVVSCGEPCEPPMAEAYWASENQLPYVDGYFRACIGDSLTLFSDNSTSVGEDNPIVSWEWDMGEGTTYTGEPSITHVYANPGLYLIDLTIEDSNNCQNQNTIDFSVLVSTNATPILTPDFPICIGDTAEITGMIEGEPYTVEPSNDFGDGLYIPDDQDQCFYSELTFTNFTPGSVIEDATIDIESFFVNMEHSYMGDLTITLTCPNNQSLAVHLQGGDGTYLGEPIDNNTDELPGIGYDYSWEPLSTNGTMADNAGFGVITLPAGSYESVQPFSNLDGCPLNGIWQIEVCDIFAIDNGFIFDWGIQFDPELYPEAVSFTPVFNLDDCDSTYWYTTGNNEFILEESQNDGDCSVVDINPTSLGNPTFIFHAVNDFGCHYEDTLNVEVIGVVAQPLTAPLTASSQQFCGEPVTIEANLSGGDDFNEADCVYTWSWDTFSSSLTLEGNDTSELTITQMDEVTIFTLDVDYTIPGTTNVCSNNFNIEIETCEITIPNIFTPNDDGVNDVWSVDGLASFNGSLVYIYDRWGVEMYSTEVDQNDLDPYWDGKYMKPLLGEIKAAAGVYYYVIKVNHGSDELITVDYYCECQDGSVDMDCCCPCAGEVDVNGNPVYDLECCPNEALMDKDGWTTYTGVLTLNR